MSGCVPLSVITGDKTLAISLHRLSKKLETCNTADSKDCPYM